MVGKSAGDEKQGAAQDKPKEISGSELFSDIKAGAIPS